jgi:uncharacterized membrane protein (DUF106 family)
MELIIYLYTVIDNILMSFFRFPNSPLLGYYLGTFILSLACVIIGEYSISIAFKVNKERITRDNKDINHFQDLSIKALKAGDKHAYKACNSIANEAFGKSFFSQIALSASSLWPLFIALGWMQYRFSEVEFSLPFSFFGTTYTVGYFLTFVVCYITTRIVFGKLKNNFSNIMKTSAAMH